MEETSAWYITVAVASPSVVVVPSCLVKYSKNIFSCLFDRLFDEIKVFYIDFKWQSWYCGDLYVMTSHKRGLNGFSCKTDVLLEIVH